MVSMTYTHSEFFLNHEGPQSANILHKDNALFIYILATTNGLFMVQLRFNKKQADPL